MARPKPEIERVPVIVRFLPEQLARVDAAVVPDVVSKGRRARIEALIDLGLEACERRAKKKPSPEEQE
jgi:hypothetical protein